jgi:hypothetical protein
MFWLQIGFARRRPFLEASKQTKPSPRKQATALVKRLAALYAPPSMRILVVTFYLTTPDFLPKINFKINSSQWRAVPFTALNPEGVALLLPLA